MKVIMCCLLVLSANLGVYLNAGETLNVPECAKAPVIDGVLDDACWKGATKCDEMFVFKTDAKTKDSSFYICRDNDWLYLAVRADNEQMRHITSRTKEDGSMVFLDECVEIFIGPVSAYRHLAVNFTGFRYAGQRRKQMPFPWLTAVQRDLKGWTAEIAVPLAPFVEGNKLPELSFNLLRTEHVPSFDVAGVPEGVSKVYHSYVQSDNAHDAGRFVKLGNMTGVKPKPVFLPQILRAEVGAYRKENGKIFYPLTIILNQDMVIPGKVRVTVNETFNDGQNQEFNYPVELSNQKELELNIPAKDLSARTVGVTLFDGVSGVRYAQVNVLDCNALKAMSIIADRNYYTDEKAVVLKASFNIPDKAGIQIWLGGQVLLEAQAKPPHMLLSLPLDKLSVGENKLEARLIQDGKVSLRQDVFVRRLPPAPGKEVKIDRINLTLLKDGKPFFPLSRLALRVKGSDERIMQHSAEHGFNTLERSDYPVEGKHDIADLSAWLKNTAKYKIYTMNKPMDTSHYHIMGKWYGKDDPIEAAFLSGDAKKIEATKKMLSENFLKLRPSLLEECRMLRDSPWFLMHMTADEPNFNPQDLRMFPCELVVRVVREADPYHPTVAVFAREIPSNRTLTEDLFDVYSYDVYSSPSDDTLYNSPGLAMAYYTYLLKKEADAAGKVAMMMPMLGGIGGGKPNCQTPAEMRCVFYTALIYGAKGILYFGQYLEVPPVHWRTTLEISRELETIALAVLAPKVEQEIVYAQNFQPEQAVFPPVNARVFRHPDGRLLLLAVNLKPQTYQSSIKIGGLTAAARFFAKDQKPEVNNATLGARFMNGLAAAARFFVNDRKVAVCNATMGERFMPYEVKVYELSLKQGSVKIEIDSVIDKSGPDETIANIPTIINDMKKSGKNYAFNPTFRLGRGPDLFPTYWHPMQSLMFDAGQPGSAWFLDAANPWHGWPSLKISNTVSKGGVGGVNAAEGKIFLPDSKKPGTFVVSFYAKADKNGKRTRLFCNPNSAVFPLTTEWTRYQAVWELTQDRYGNMLLVRAHDSDMVMWISGLQVEKGSSPTDFQDDTMENALSRLR